MKLTVKELLDLMPSYQLFDITVIDYPMDDEYTDLSRETTVAKFGKNEVYGIKTEFTQGGYELEDGSNDGVLFDSEIHTCLSITIKPIEPPFKFGDMVYINTNCILPHWRGLEGVVLDSKEQVTTVYLKDTVEDGIRRINLGTHKFTKI